MTTYRDRLTEAMTLLAEDPRVMFLGQSIVAGGTAMTATFRDVPRERMIETPVFEDTQMGIATGLSLTGAIPVAVYPRINFLLLAMNQLVLHLDAIPLYSDYRPKVIIRTSIASPIPLDPGPQHVDPEGGNYLSDEVDLVPTGYVAALRAMLRTIHVIELFEPYMIVPYYMDALRRPTSTILVERAELYETEDQG